MMSLEVFVSILVLSATTTSVGIEIFKKFLNTMNMKYKTMPVAVAIAFILGVAEIFVYEISEGIPISSLTFLYAICMGVANTMGATTGYDTVKAFIFALFAKPN